MKELTRIALESSAQSIVQAYGERAQLVKSCEELGELTTQLCKWLNFDAKTADGFDAVVDEIADVYIMLAQLRVIFGSDAIEDQIVTKLNRTIDAIRKPQRLEKRYEEAGL